MKKRGIRACAWSMVSACIALMVVSCSDDDDGPADPGVPCPSSYPNAKIIFITSYSGTGNLKAWMSTCSGRSAGLEAADCICQTLARTRGKLSGTYKAWLSDSRTSAASRLTHADVPYVNRRGEIIANNWSDLISGALQCTDIMGYDETGERSLYQPLAWTGTDKNGNIHALNKLCDDWTNGVASLGGMCGAVYVVPGNFGGCWTEWGWRNCDEPANCLYCVEQ